jgi:putative aminopeptidase FrvX
METTYTWTAAGADATEMTLRNRGEPAGFASVAAPVMAGAVRRATHSDLAKLKSLLESEQFAPPAR